MQDDNKINSLIAKFYKTFLYIRIYGISRTLGKIKGKYHLNSIKTFDDNYWENSRCKSPINRNRFVAIIGCGLYSYSNIAYYLKRINKRFLRGVLDVDSSQARSLCEDYSGAYATTDLKTILNDSQVKLVFIASNHASHAQYAIDCIKAGKHVHIEKPHVVSWDQLSDLKNAMELRKDVKIFLGFNRPRSNLFQKLLNQVKSQSGPIMINWFILGHQLDNDHWYYNSNEGGRVLGNLCHWTDLTYHMIGSNNVFPCEIIPSSPQGSKSDYVVSINFQDKSTAVITFSAKGHLSTGVVEILNLQIGDCAARLINFEKLIIDSGYRNKKWKPIFRDHGHKNNFANSYNSVANNSLGESKEYIINTAKLFLSIRDAIESGEKIILN